MGGKFWGTTSMAHANYDKDHYSTKPPKFKGEKFDYCKDKIDFFCIFYDSDLLYMVIDGYTHPTYADVTKFERRKMNE